MDNKNELILPWNIYNIHYKVIKIINCCELYSTYEVSYKHCICSKTRTADYRAPSNLRKHFKDKHSSVKSVRELLALATTVSIDVKRKFNTEIHDNSDVKKNQKYLDQMNLDVIINANLPFNLAVSHESFKTIISKGYPGRTVLCRQTLMKRKYDSYKVAFDKLKNKLNLVELVSTTADAWSAFKRILYTNRDNCYLSRLYSAKRSAYLRIPQARVMIFYTTLKTRIFLSESDHENTKTRVAYTRGANRQY